VAAPGRRLAVETTSQFGWSSGLSEWSPGLLCVREVRCDGQHNPCILSVAQRGIVQTVMRVTCSFSERDYMTTHGEIKAWRRP
jgi:hypothetical protein